MVIEDSSNSRFNRKDIILNVANKEGGAHVDSTLDEAYANLTRFNSMRWSANILARDIELSSPVYPSVRQIAHEVMKSVLDEFPKIG